MGQGLVRTVLVFTDLPVHIEFAAQPMPLLEKGTVLDFDLVLSDPRDTRKRRHVSGDYEVAARKLRYSSKSALSQYLELTPVKK